VRGFELEAATALKGTLAGRGVETEVVDEATLPQLPESRQVHRADCTPEGLVITIRGPELTLGWQNIWVIAAGWCGRRISSRVEVRDRPIDTGRLCAAGGLPKGDEGGTERSCRGGIIHYRAALRYTLKMDRLDCMSFQYLGPRRTQNWVENFALMVQDMIKFATTRRQSTGARTAFGSKPWSRIP